MWGAAYIRRFQKFEDIFVKIPKNELQARKFSEKFPKTIQKWENFQKYPQKPLENEKIFRKIPKNQVKARKYDYCSYFL